MGEHFELDLRRGPSAVAASLFGLVSEVYVFAVRTERKGADDFVMCFEPFPTLVQVVVDFLVELRSIGFSRLRHGFLFDLACDYSVRRAIILARDWAKADGQGTRMNAFVMHLTEAYPQPTGQRLSTPYLLLVFLA